MVVFDGVAGPDDAGLFEPRDRGHHRALHLFRQRGGDAVRIDGGVVEAFRLEEDLMPVALAEADDLVLDRGAIARTAARDLAGIHRRAMHIGADHGVGRLGRAGDAALDLRIGDLVGQRRERLGRIVRRPASRAPPSRWSCRRGAAACRSSVGPALKPEPLQRERTRPIAGASPTRPAGVCCSPIWIRPRRKVPVVSTTARGAKLAAVDQAQARDTAVRNDQIVGLGLDHGQVCVARQSRRCMAAA